MIFTWGKEKVSETNIQARVGILVRGMFCAKSLDLIEKVEHHVEEQF